MLILTLLFAWGAAAQNIDLTPTLLIDGTAHSRIVDYKEQLESIVR